MTIYRVPFTGIKHDEYDFVEADSPDEAVAEVIRRESRNRWDELQIGTPTHSTSYDQVTGEWIGRRPTISTSSSAETTVSLTPDQWAAVNRYGTIGAIDDDGHAVTVRLVDETEAQS